jgi:predicted peroxiredoxin
MDLRVELHVVGAEALRWFDRSEPSDQVLESSRRAAQLGVELFACSAAMAERGVDIDRLIAEFKGARGAASLLASAMGPGARVLSF